MTRVEGLGRSESLSFHHVGIHCARSMGGGGPERFNETDYRGSSSSKELHERAGRRHYCRETHDDICKLFWLRWDLVRRLQSSSLSTWGMRSAPSTREGTSPWSRSLVASHGDCRRYRCCTVPSLGNPSRECRQHPLWIPVLERRRNEANANAQLEGHRKDSNYEAYEEDILREIETRGS